MSLAFGKNGEPFSFNEEADFNTGVNALKRS